MHKHTSTHLAALPLLRSTISGSALILLASLVTSQAKSDTYTYMGGDGGYFSTGFNPPLPSGGTTTSDSLNFGGISYTATDDILTLNLNSLNFTNNGAVILASSDSNNSLILGGFNPTITLNNIGVLTVNLNLSMTANTTLTGSGSATINGMISGTNSLVLGTSTTPFTGNLTLTGTNTYRGGTSINGGSLNFANGSLGTSGNISFGGGTLQYASGNTQDISSRIISSTAAIAIDTNGNNVTFSGNLQNTGGLTKKGAGVLSLNGFNSYTGVTTINGGVLKTASIMNGNVSSGIGRAQNIAANLVLNGGILQYTGASTSTDRLFTLGASGGTLDASGTGAINFSGNGSLAVTTAGARALTLTGTNTGSNTLSAQITDSTNASGGITSVAKNGTGTWILANSTNSYTGGTSINGGTLSVSNDNTLGAAGSIINFNGGTLQTGTSGITSSRAVVLGANGGTIDTNGNNSAFAGGITDASGASGALTKNGAGTLTLSGTNTYSGGTTVNAGVATGTTASYGIGNITVASGATVDYTQSGAGTMANNITGAGTATFGGQTGSPNGTGGTVNYTGNDSAAHTIVGAGATLQLNNSSGPALSGPVAVTPSGALTINPNGTSNEIATAAPPTASPTVAAVTLNGGTLNADGSDGAVNDPTHLATTSVSQSMGALALGGSATQETPSLLNLGAGTSGNPFILAFADSSQTLGSGYLNVTGYTGTTNALYVGTGSSLTQNQLNQIAYNGMYGAFSQLGNGELVLAAAPEPSGVVSPLLGAGGLAGLVFLRRRRAAKAA